MTNRLSQSMLRARLAEILSRVSRGDEIIVERRGKPLAALISAAKFDRMRRFARRHALDVLTQQQGGPLTDAQATELGVEALGAATTAQGATANDVKGRVAHRWKNCYDSDERRVFQGTAACSSDTGAAPRRFRVVRQAVQGTLDDSENRRESYRRAAQLVGAFNDRARSRHFSRRHDEYFSR